MPSTFSPRNLHNDKQHAWKLQFCDAFEGWQSIRGSNLRRTNGACIKYIKRDDRLPRFHRWNPRTALEQFSTGTSRFRFYPRLEGSRALWFLQDFRGQASSSSEVKSRMYAAGQTSVLTVREIAYFIVPELSRIRSKRKRFSTFPRSFWRSWRFCLSNWSREIVASWDVKMTFRFNSRILVARITTTLKSFNVICSDEVFAINCTAVVQFYLATKICIMKW